MALDLTGILNENEFYTDYYFRTILPDRLKAWVKKVRQADGEAPVWATLKKMGGGGVITRQPVTLLQRPTRPNSG